jgi:hypothetical protein
MNIFGVYRTWWGENGFLEEAMMKLFLTEEKANSYVEYLATEYSEYHKKENLAVRKLQVF